MARAVKALPEDWDALFLGYHDDAGRPHPAISREADAEIEVGGGPIQGKFSGETFGGAWFLTRVHRLRQVVYADWPSNTRIMCRLKTVFVCNFESSI